MTNPTPTEAEKLARELVDKARTLPAPDMFTWYDKMVAAFVPILERALEMKSAIIKAQASSIMLLEAKLQPSSCGVEGHRMVDWTPSDMGLVGESNKEWNRVEGAPRVGNCLACQRREQRGRG